MLRRDDVVEFENRARGNEQRQHHGKPSENRAGDKVRRENCGVPRRQDRRREVEGHDAVNRQHQRRRKSGQKQVGHFVMPPVAIRAAPAAGENAEEKFFDLGGGAVAQRRQVRNQSGVPKQNRHREIG